jgi:hypothetical protein
MQSTRTLPDKYVTVGTLDISKNRRAIFILNVFGLVLLFLAGWFFLRVLFWLRPADALQGFNLRISGFADGMRVISALVFITAAAIILHEAVHGIFFVIYTRSRPVFALKFYYAYASAPGWYLPRNQYLITSLAPLILLSLLGILLLAWLPPVWFLPVLFFCTFNASGAVGDLAVAGWLLKQPVTCYGQDNGDAVTLYVPVESQE